MAKEGGELGCDENERKGELKCSYIAQESKASALRL